MAYGKFRFDSKNFFMGVGALFVALCLPMISQPIIDLSTKIRSKIGGN